MESVFKFNCMFVSVYVYGGTRQPVVSYKCSDDSE